MEDRWGLGPVFVYEWLTGSRSPRVYLTRAVFVLALLIVLGAVWWSENEGKTLGTIRDFAEAGASFYLGLVGTQLVLVLLAAPSATAGAICLDKSRGTLTHLLVTDLSDPEIVLGKLAARLVPTLTLVFCALPVQFIASLLGGIDPGALIGSTFVTLGVAILACSLALTISVWGKKTQDVLITTYIILLLWLLAYPTALGFGRGNGWLWKLDPFQLAMAPYSTDPSSVGWLDFLVFFALMLGSSTVLVVFAVWRFRAVAARGDQLRAEKARREWRWLRRFQPSLDSDPVLWREWHRARPSRWVRWIWRFYYALAAIFSLLAIERSFAVGPGNNTFGLFVVGFEVAIGLLLLSVDAATSLAEERARGSLDVLLTTPLTTWSIVRAKWRGAYRRVFSLAVLPVIVTAVSIKGNRFIAVSMALGLILAYGAAITSLGLALATWVRRLGRAVALSVGIYALVTVGGFFVCLAGIAPNNYEAEMAMVSPFYGPIYSMDNFQRNDHKLIGPVCALGWVVFYSTSAVLLFLATLATFDRCMGRSRDRPSGSVRRRVNSRRLIRRERFGFGSPTSGPIRRRSMTGG
jgi:ABC-type transport system involved in multi-copper enzyme maturation permease subunit